MTTAYERWKQTKCCICPSPDRRECVQIRYDIQLEPDDPWNLIDDACECRCHDEYDDDEYD